ncbi:radical SAM protein [Candidatus Woesearchaeota archaeon]|nr:radical SAM protein [Candidatus Woesearchaeota archaeon]
MPSPTVTFQSLRFKDADKNIKAALYKHFIFSIPKADLEGYKYEVLDNGFHFQNMPEKKAQLLVHGLIGKYIKELKNQITGNPAIYVHRNLGLPLMGSVGFGIVDRGSSIIEIKPITGCNLDCIFCSVDEHQRDVDFILEVDYLVEELRKILAYKQHEGMEIHIGPQAEPFLYEPMLDLIDELAKLPEVRTVSTDTNGTLLNEEKIDRMSKTGKMQINLSFHAVDPELARELFGGPYNVKRIMELARYMRTKLDMTIAPVFLQSYNKNELGKIIEFYKELLAIPSPYKCRIGIQNFLLYPGGKKPDKEMPWDSFFALLKELEQENGVQLILTEKDFSIVPTKELPKPFRKEEIITAKIFCPGRFPKEKIVVARDRTITVVNCAKKSGMVRVKITRTKHNVFAGVVG